MEDTKLKRESFYCYWLLFLETSKKKEKRAPSLSQHKNLNIHRLDLTTTLAPGHRSDPLYSSLFLLLLRTYVLTGGVENRHLLRNSGPLTI